MKPPNRNNGSVLLRDDPLWYKDAIIYELHVRTFCDSNADGIGDFRGLTRQLDYLQDLGITVMWVLPFYPSPLRDDGYDIAKYTDVHPDYGTLDDFKIFLHEAHRRGLRVITELVVNHTSDRHPWFQRARRAPAGSNERNFYVWSDTTDKYRDARIIFKDFETSNWTWDAEAGAYYWHRFYSHQPDLNYDNPEVEKAVLQVLDFWLDMGVDGLRLDAIPYLYERDGTNCENLPETHQFLKRLRGHVEQKYRGRMLLAEANQWPEDAVAYFGQGDECHMAYHFPVMPRLFMALRMEDRFPIVDILEQTPAIPETSQWAIFLRNHDELTLEMVTEEDRDYMYRVYARDPQARINLGIRRRLAPLLDNNRAKIQLMNGLLFSLPGTPVLYYGDEIGMGDNIYLGDRNGVRTPMQWNSERNAGFSRANPQRLCLPLILDPEYRFEVVNVEEQQNNPHSLLWWMKHLIALRKSSQAFGRGSLEFLMPRNARVLAFLRQYRNERLLVVANLSRYAQAAELELSEFSGFVPVEMFGRSRFPVIEADRPYALTLGPYAFFWFVLRPGRVEVPPAPEELLLAELEVAGSWTEVVQGEGRPALEAVLPGHLNARVWFTGRQREIAYARIAEAFLLPATQPVACLALVDVAYTDGDPETYLLPMAFAPGTEEEQSGPRVEAPIAQLTVTAEGETVRGLLYDPAGEAAFSEALLEALAHGRRLPHGGGELVATPTGNGRAVLLSDELHAEPVLLRGDQSHTSVAFGDRWLLKMFRRIETGINPEVEVGRFLCEQAQFPSVPAVLGTIDYHEGDEPMTLAVLQQYVVNQGDAWKYTLEALGTYFERALTTPDRKPQAARFPADLLEAATQEVPASAQELIGPYLESARLLGQRTAELHVALASAPHDPAFAPEPFTAQSQRSLYQVLRSQLRRTFDLLRQRRRDFEAPLAAEVDAVLGQEESLLQHARAILGSRLTAQRLRCHDDYHLRQVLYTGKDFVIIDLEGENGLSMNDRRRKRSPLRDVASMLHSFQYAALVALRQGRVRPVDTAALEPWVGFWNFWVGATFLRAYLDGAAASSFLPRTSEELRILLENYLIVRAAAGLRKELGSRPERVRVPLLALARVAHGLG